MKDEDDSYIFSQMDELSNKIAELSEFDKRYYKPLCEALQKVTNIRPSKKRSNVVKEK